VLIPSLRITNPLPGISPRALLLISLLFALHIFTGFVQLSPFPFGNNKVQVVTLKQKSFFEPEPEKGFRCLSPIFTATLPTEINHNIH
jgi:CRISPR/Cas system endoribonuclease Cas6 (RAMP superfamily)